MIYIEVKGGINTKSMDISGDALNNMMASSIGMKD
jgi:hypothetical protein